MQENQVNVCSLFDGMSCMQIALKVAGITPTKYFASEIEKFPIKSTMTVFPNTIQIGDVRNVKGSDLGFIHILAGGSPCQSFSFAGKRKGMATKCDVEILTLDHYLELKSQNFEFEGQSYLFWEYMRILHELQEINPDIKFLLENVVMGEKWQNILTKAIGINPIKINSALVSAQNRNRLYWTNIGSEPVGFFGDLECGIPQPKDKGILLKDVLETFEKSNFEIQEDFYAYMDKYFLSDKALSGLINQNKKHKDKGNGFSFNPTDGNKKGNAITNPSKNRVDDNYIVHNTMPISSKTGKGGGKQPYQHNRVYDVNGISPCLNTDARSPSIEVEVVGGDFDFDGNFRERPNGKSGTLRARARNDESCSQLAMINKTIRRLTPRECGRLQTVPEDILDVMLNCGISDTQLYKMFGNGWTIDVIAYMLSYYKIEKLQPQCC